MANASVYHVVPNEGQWAVKREGSDRAIRVDADRDNVIRDATTFVRNQAAGRVVIHRADGAIESVHTYDTLPVESGRDWMQLVLSKPALALAGTVFLVAVGWSLRDRF